MLDEQFSEKRATQKQASRFKDDMDLRENRITREELSKQNSIFAAFDIPNATIKRRTK